MIEQISPEQLGQWVASHTANGITPLLIDVREPWEWQIASAVDWPACELARVPMGTIPTELNSLDPDRPTALLCHHGRRSQNVALFLQQNGFTVLANIAGGIDAWSDLDERIPRY